MKMRDKEKRYTCGAFPIDKMRQFFQNRILPDEIHLDDHTYIKDVKMFVETHISYLVKNDCNSVFIPYYQRLRLLKELLIQSEDW